MKTDPPGTEMNQSPSSVTFKLKDAIAKGRELRNAGQLDEAYRVFEQISRQVPHRAAGWIGMGQISLDQFKAGEAVIALERAMNAGGPTAELQHALGSAKSLLGRMPEAKTHYDEALKLKPRNADFYHNYVRIKKFSKDDTIQEEIEAFLAEPDLSDKERCHLHFAAGKVYDDLRQFDDAFDHFRRGNEFKHASFDRAQWTGLIDRIIEFFDAPTIERIRAQARPTKSLVFIVGMPRSGTTLIEQILSSHSQVFGAGELPDLNAISGELVKLTGAVNRFPECLANVDAKTFMGLGNFYLQRVGEMAAEANHSKTTVSVDKAPNNFAFIGLMHALFPDVRVVHCRRDPLDTCLSCYMTNFKKGQEYAYNFGDLAHYYGEYRRLMRHWESVATIPMINIDYESVVADQEGMSRQLIDFVGLDWEDRCLDYQSNRRVVATASSWQVRQPIYKGSMRRWKNYELPLKPLIEALRTHGVDCGVSDLDNEKTIVDS